MRMVLVGVLTSLRANGTMERSGCLSYHCYHFHTLTYAHEFFIGLLCGCARRFSSKQLSWQLCARNVGKTVELTANIH